MQPLVVPVLPASRDMIGSTALQMALLPTDEGFVNNSKSDIFKLIDELAWEGADAAEAKKLLESTLSSPEVSTTTVGEMAIAADQSEDASVSLNSCEAALVDLTIDIIGLILTIAGLPSTIGKKAGKAIVKKAQKRLTKEARRIATQYFRNAEDLFSVATGIWEFMGVLLTVMSLDNLIGTIVGSMTWWEVILYSIWIAAQLALLFVTNIPGIVVKLALATPDIIDLVKSTVTVINECD